MRAQDLRHGELITHDPGTGLPFFGSTRLLMVGVGPLTRMGQDLLARLGESVVEAIFFRFGFEAGLGMAAMLSDMYPWENETEWFLAGSRMRNLAGLAVETMDEVAFDRARGFLRFKGRWRESFQSLLQVCAQPPLETLMGCTILAGASSGYASGCLGREVLVRELSCVAQGSPECVFEGRPVEEWGLTPQELRHQFSLPQVADEVARLHRALALYRGELSAQQDELLRLRRRAAPEASGQGGIIFRSEAMGLVLELARKVAASATTVLITGETGTGKEKLARFIHANSGRAQQPYLAVNCAALPPNLLESELFGHLRGSFTGAERDKKGLFVEAGAGTLFLDEVGELPLELQAKLLRALQEREVRPVGGARNQPVQARILAASNRDLKEMVAEGRLREDLYYRLAVIPMRVPPLRQRREDILPLARHFLARFAADSPGFAPDTVRAMERHDWPGNVRELENAVEYAVVLAGGERIEPGHLPLGLGERRPESLGDLVSDLPSQEEMVRRYTAHVLEHTRGNRSQAARILGIGVNTLWRRLKEGDPAPQTLREREERP